MTGGPLFHSPSRKVVDVLNRLPHFACAYAGNDRTRTRLCAHPRALANAWMRACPGARVRNPTHSRMYLDKSSLVNKMVSRYAAGCPSGLLVPACVV